MKSTQKLRLTGVVMSFAAVAVRLLPHPPNFTPMGATALFGGAKFTRPWNYLLPIGLMFATDLFLGFHNTMLYVYGSFLIITFLGERWAKKPTTARIVTLGLASSSIFFLVTNFGVWAQGTLYPPTFAGLIESYVAAIPFWQNMLLADLVFSVGYFKLFAYFETTKLPVLDEKVYRYLIKGGI